LATTTPKEYRDFSLFSHPIVDRVNNLHVEIIGTRVSGSNLILKFLLLSSGEKLSGIYFRFGSRQTKIFHFGNRLYIRGKVKENEFGIQIVNPYSIGKPKGEIDVIYRDKSMGEAVLKYINYENLKKHGLPFEHIEKILEIHRYPTAELVAYFEEFGEFPEEHLKTLKFVEIFHYIRGTKSSIVEYPPLQKLSGDWRSWAESLPFKLTGDQQRAISEIAEDMSSERAMRRVVVGDVGSGKTMVILASMVIACPQKSVLMAPTSILAEQLFEEAKKFLPEEYKTVLLTSKTSKKEKLEDFNILIGTSAVLYRELPEIPLVIIDEQHRFGTRERNKLQKLVEREDKKPHFIQLSATPIPRTQAMINSTFIKVSLIEEIPFKKNIATSLLFSRDFPQLLEKIEEELEKENQILIIYPLVEESEKINYQSLEESVDYWRENFDSVFMTHGKDKEKDEVLRKFREEGKILLATTVVEVGISLPRLTVVVIVGAERLGLATLHQLRGRVSRTGLDGFCYLYTKSKERGTIERLKKFSKTTNGFDIASMDLENRKGGDIVKGKKQSGETFQWFDLVKDASILEEVKEVLEE
jgi:ATP-dependent DNA helicase RecG